MTNLDKLKTKVSDTHGVILTDNHWIGALEDNDLESSQEYNKASDAQAMDMATISILDIILDSSNLQEGDLRYDITNKSIVQDKIDTILIKWGLETRYQKKTPTIDSVSSW